MVDTIRLRSDCRIKMYGKKSTKRKSKWHYDELKCEDVKKMFITHFIYARFFLKL